MSKIHSYAWYIKTILWSRKRRKYLEKYGFQKTVQKYPTIQGNTIVTSNQVSKAISYAIFKKEPYMVGRFGNIELLNTGKTDVGIKFRIDESVKILSNNAGFFPDDVSMLSRFATIMKESMKLCDLQGMWYIPFEDYYLKSNILTPSLITEGRYLEPWFSENPWTNTLAGKKVLVIHPFDELIKEQYKKRKLLFPNKDILPDFQLKTFKAVQTIAGTSNDQFATWFDALNYMCEEIDKIDYDVAIIGCGAYGYPIAAHVKKSGKVAIHLGGVTQVLFGIKGKRWDIDPLDDTVRNLYNDSWVYPGEREKPKQLTKVEGGCYW